MKQLITFFLLCITSTVWSDDGMEVTNTEQVAALIHIQEKIDSVSTAVMACIDSGKDHAVCLCESQPLITDFNTSVTELFVAHPSLEDQGLVRFKTPKYMWVTQNLAGIKQQANTLLSCP